MYYVLTKVLFNGLQKVIRNVISEIESTFVKRRQVMDGTIITNEVVDKTHKLKKESLLRFGGLTLFGSDYVKNEFFYIVT